MTMYIIKNLTGQFFQQFGPGLDYKPGDPLMPAFGNEASKAQLIDSDMLAKMEKTFKEHKIQYVVEPFKKPLHPR